MLALGLAGVLPVAPAAAAPAAPTLQARVGNGVVELSWTPGGTAGVVLRALAGTTAPMTTTDGRGLTPGAEARLLDSGLVNGQPHSYSIWSVDTDGTVSDVPTSLTATPAPAAATTLRLVPSTTLVAAGRPITLNARLFQSGSGVAVSGAAVDVFARQGGTTVVRRIATVRTRADGVALHTFVPRVAAEYQLRWAGDPFAAAAASPKRVVRVQPRMNGRFSPNAVATGGSSAVVGSIYPAYQGARVLLQKKVTSGSGTTFQTVLTMATSPDGRYTAPLTPKQTAGYRVVLVATAAYNGASTPTFTLRVDPRVLRVGMQGPDVLAVEQALWTQGKADVGRLDGVFDNDTRHGVIAFQKSQGMARTGVFDAATRNRLATAVPRGARYPVTGRSVEIDLSQQVLRVFEGGRLARLADVSTGNDELYESEGVTYRAFTPIGRFSIQRKIDGIRVSRLGELYRPAYFTGGWAVHGSPSVPIYPASHGCVRVTNSQMDRLFPLLTIGTPLAVYQR